jgi:N-methylhydantoinase A/oxoprolinase/acetone carboxylase beta subunit
MSLRLGIDTGGTYTDAVLMDDSSQSVVAKSKSLTTRHNLIEGIQSAIANTLGDRDPADVSLVSLSTTLATNSIVEGHGARAALLLVGYQQSQLKLGNLSDAARDLPIVFIDGGHDAGGHEKLPLDLASAATALEQLDESLSAVAVSAMFAVRNPEHEIALRDFIRQKTGLPVSCGHELSASLDAPRRALTALINARLIPLIKTLIDATRGSLQEHGISAPLMVVRGDGSLVSAEFAERTPVETILSGPAASVVGAQFLAKRDRMIVSDIGGTTTDVAFIQDGQPGLSRDGASVNGWRTMVEAVQIETHGLGGDSEILYDRENRKFSIGPQKVMPLCLLADRYPAVVNDLRQFVDEPWTKTNMARFIVLRRLPYGLKLTAQQQALVDQVANHPQSMQSVFAERHFSLALKRLIEIGVLTIAGFTPTDAAHVCGWYDHWSPEASILGAILLSRYSKFNLGREWPDEKSFCQSILAQVSEESALCVLSSAINESNQVFGSALHPKQRALLEQMFRGNGELTSGRVLGMRAQLSVPLVGIGAPAASFYPPVSDYVDIEVIVPEHAEVANAVGAVVGVVKQSVQLTITPVSGKRVMVHAPLEQREFDTLEPAAQWAAELATELATARAQQAGAAQIEVSIDRKDNIVEQQGQSTFFESTIVATASGRAGGKT